VVIPGAIEVDDLVDAVIVHDGISSVVRTRVTGVDPLNPYPFEVVDEYLHPGGRYRCCRGDLRLIQKGSGR
jgi:hypothetical protein